MNQRPKLLDLFCGAGGAAMGYYRAGFDVVGVDIKPMPRYPFEFVQVDAIDMLRRMLYGGFLSNDGDWYFLNDFSAIHASPPCQAYSITKGLTNKEYPMLIDDTRRLLLSATRPYVIENVVGAPLLNATLLCGVMFGLRTYRHRLFETSFDMPLLLHMTHGATKDDMKWPSKRLSGYMVQVVGHPRYKGGAQRYKEAMQIDWMNTDEITEAIPPAYTEFIGAHLLKVVTERAQGRQ